MKQPDGRRRALILTGALVVALSALPSGVRVRAQQSREQQLATDISPEALAQIEALIREKESRSEVERKIDSQLIYELKMQAGQPLASGVDSLETDIPYADDGHAVVDVKARVTSELMVSLSKLGIEVLSSTPEESSLRLHVDIEQLEALAGLPDIVFVQPKQEAVTGRWHGATPRPGREKRAAAVSRFVSAAIGQHAQPDVLVTQTGQGSKTSEGDITHLAFAARRAFGASGKGVKIGVLSDGVSNLAASQALGDLGPVTVLAGQAGFGDEGTAVLEIIHDLAPDAQLYFATAFISITSFADNIRALRAAGCDIVVDDVLYFAETPFQDGQAPGLISNTNGGVVIQAVNDVTADGALYFSSAGNSGNLNDGTAGVWEGDFVDGGATGPPLPSAVGRVHSFGDASFNTLTVANTEGPISLYWSDPLGGSSNDYDLFRLDAAGTFVIASSTNIQNGTRDPYEQISQSTLNPRIVIVKKTNALPRFLHLNTNRGQLSIATAGQIHGHAGAMNASAVAATPAAGPFPNAFTSSNVVEPFSSDGPRRVFYRANGAPITPGDLSATGGFLRQKPNITAADGVSVTGVGGFPTPFFGTSAAAPHAAAIAALIKSANPESAFTVEQILEFMSSSAIDIETPGVDRDAGAGIVMANAALIAAGVSGTALVEIGNVDVSDNPGNGNGAPEAGEGARLIIPLVNYGGSMATAISATLSSSTAGISITQPNARAYPNLPPGISVPGSSPWLFTIANDFPCPMSAVFTLSVTFTDGPNPKTLEFQVPVPIGPRPFSIAKTLDGIAPAAGFDFTPITGTQTGRINRLLPPSACGTSKAFPGLATTTGTRQFDAYSFATCGTVPACVQVSMTNGAAGVDRALFDVAYIGSFNPANLRAGYAGDPGASNIAGHPISFAFSLPSGEQSFAIAVHEVDPGRGIGDNYSLTVSGACFGACATPNKVPVAKAKNVTVFADNSCTAYGSIDDGSSDADDEALTITQSPPGPYPLGTITVLLTVTDPKGAMSQATGTVTVVDKAPPSIACPASIVADTPSGACSTPVSFALPTASDACSASVNVATSPASGSLFSIGTTSVTGTATDAAGNSATCSFTVTVVDKEAPSIACPAPIVSNTAPGTCSAPVTFGLPTASDACSTPVNIATSIPSGAPFSLGTTPVVGTATDAAGNSATCPFAVTVVDNEPPTVTGFALSVPRRWPDHKMVDVTVGYGLADNCVSASCVLSVSVTQPPRHDRDDDKRHADESEEDRTSDKDLKKGHHDDDDETGPDWIVVDAHHVRLRAEGSENDHRARIYTITLTCTDAAGNTTVRTATLPSVHDRN